MEIGITLNNELIYNKNFSKEEELRSKEELAKFILKDKRLTRCTVFLIAGINYATNAMADIGETMAKVDNAGWMFLGIIQGIGFWVCLLGCLLELLLAVFKEGRGKNAILPLIIKWLGIFATFYFLPTVFMLIRDLFS